MQERKTPAVGAAGHVARTGLVEMTGAGEQRNTRARTCCCTAARSCGVSAATWAKWTCPSSPTAHTSSINRPKQAHGSCAYLRLVVHSCPAFSSAMNGA